MHALTLTYAISGTPGFGALAAGLELLYTNELLLAIVESEEELLDREKFEGLDEKEREVYATYFVPSTDDQAKVALSLIIKFANEEFEDVERRTFVADVLTAMYFRSYDILIKNLKGEETGE